MRKQLSTMVVAIAINAALTSLAIAGEQQAYIGTAADAATTGAALATPGIGEANPLGWMTVPIRMAVVEHAKTLPRDQGQPIMDAVSASSWAAAANNLLMLAGASAAAPVVGVAVGYALWKQGETEREFWQLCAVHQQMNPQAKCEFRAWTPQEAMRLARAQPDRQHATAPMPSAVASSL